MRAFLIALILRMIFARNSDWLFGGQGEYFTGIVDHLTHITDAFGALGLALVCSKDIAWALGPGLDRRADLTFANAVAITDVQGGRPDRLRMTLHITPPRAIARRSQRGPDWILALLRATIVIG